MLRRAPVCMYVWCVCVCAFVMCRFETPGLKIVGSTAHLSEETKEFVEMFRNPDFVQVRHYVCVCVHKRVST